MRFLNATTAWFQVQAAFPSGGTSFSAMAGNDGSFAAGSGTSGPTKTRCSTRRMFVSTKVTAFGKAPTTTLTLTLVAVG